MANLIDVDVKYLRSAVTGQLRLNGGLLRITGKEKRCLPEVDANYQAVIILIVELVVRPAGIALETNLVDKCNGRGRVLRLNIHAGKPKAIRDSLTSSDQLLSRNRPDYWILQIHKPPRYGISRTTLPEGLVHRRFDLPAYHVPVDPIKEHRRIYTAMNCRHAIL